jgi:prepilin-type N-terminal cleavage/methylation domain-containing protein
MLVIMRTRQLSQAGFTLTEIMIVVAVIGLLAVMAIPAFARSRARSAQTLCTSNLRRIDDAKAQWAMDTGKGMGVRPHDDDLFGPTLYIQTKPQCPAGGQYDLGKVKEPPTCTIAGHELIEADSTAGPGQAKGGL